jgi:hypothetical protein
MKILNFFLRPFRIQWARRCKVKDGRVRDGWMRVRENPYLNRE